MILFFFKQCTPWRKKKKNTVKSPSFQSHSQLRTKKQKKNTKENEKKKKRKEKKQEKKRKEKKKKKKEKGKKEEKNKDHCFNSFFSILFKLKSNPFDFESKIF